MPVGYRFRSERNALMKQSLVTERILSYVGKNLESAMTLDTIAKELHYSKFYLERTFKKDMGISLYQYIRRRRLNEAAEKLGNTDRPVIEIALEAGYLSQQAFAQAFDGKSCRYGTSRTVDIELNILFRVLRFQKKQLSRDHACRLIIHILAQKNDPVREETRINVITPFALV